MKYPWIDKTWVDDTIKEILGKTTFITTRKLYYSFFILTMEKMNLRLASGDEMEDSDFKIYGIFMSQNVLLVKLLEYMAIKQQLDWYVDELLGLRKSRQERVEEMKYNEREKEERKKKGAKGGKKEGEEEGHGSGFREGIQKIRDNLDRIGLDFAFMKNTPYEKDFDERIGKIHLRGMAKERYAPIVNFLKDKIGIGKGGEAPAPPPPKPPAPAHGGGH